MLRRKRLSWALVCLVGLTGALSVGCSGQGDLYVWNGTEHRYDVEVMQYDRGIDAFTLFPDSGRTLSLRPSSYEYRLKPHEGGSHRGSVAVARNSLSLLNIAKQTCFARIDVSGMYRASKSERAEVLELYHRTESVVFHNPVHVRHGQSLPRQMDASIPVVQRLISFPCDLMDKAHPMIEVREIARRMQ